MNRAATFELTLNRHIRAPREKVFDAFVTAEAMKAWMCPRGLSIPELELDARVGGGFRIAMRARDGDTYRAVASYREIKRPERLVYTWQWVGEGMPNVETLITVTFAEREGGTDLCMRHSGFPDQAMCDSHKEGWGSSLNRLADALDPRGSAASVALLGDPRSTYVRTARIGLAEKGVQYAFEPAPPHTPAILEIHPFGRIPAFRDGDVRLFETSAILRYVEEAFPGPSLLPGNIRDRAIAEQWVSAINCYFYDLAIRRYVLQYVFPKGADGKPDRAVIDAAAKELAEKLAIFERGYARSFLAGQQPTLPDYFLAPIVAYLELFPESKEMLSRFAKLARAHAAVKERRSFRDTEPPRA
jgi:glutathione S-transferase